MAFSPVPSFVPNTPLELAKNLRYRNRAGNLVTQELPADYITTTGDTLSVQIDNYNIILASLTNTNNVVIPSMQAQINSILTSGAVAIPNVSSGCLSSGTTMPINTVVDLLVANTCAYNTVLGQPSSLYQAIATQGPNLSLAQAFSQNSAMAGIAGWVTIPHTLADCDNNQWLTILDARAGITRALAAVTPTCAQVIINYQAVVDNTLTFLIYFSGYTFIPSGYTDAGSAITITDTTTGIYTQALNVVTQSNTVSPLTLYTSGSTLSPQSTSYTVKLNSNVVNTALGLTCEKVTIIRIENPNSTPADPGTCCPDIGTYTGILSSGSTALTVVSTLSYTPRYAEWVPGNAFTAAQFYPGGSPPYITRALGGFVLHFSSPTSATGTVLLDWITYR